MLHTSYTTYPNISVLISVSDITSAYIVSIVSLARLPAISLILCSCSTELYISIIELTYIFKILNTEVDFYNFSFLYKILAGLYLVDRYYCAAGTVYINKETRQLCSQIEYSVMNKVDKDMCILVDNADAAKYASSKLVKMYVSSMILMYNSVEQEQSIKEIAGSLAKLTMETIYADVISDTVLKSYTEN